MLQEAPRFTDRQLSLEERFKRGYIDEDSYFAELRTSEPLVKGLTYPEVKKRGDKFATPEDLIRGGWIPSQRDIAYFVGRKPEGQSPTIGDLLNMISIDVSGRPDLIRANFFGKLGVVLTARPLVDEGLASIKRTKVLTKVSMPSLN